MLLLLVFVLVIIAVGGGLAISPIFWFVLLAALLVFIFSRRGAGV
jgi:uncharacterized membrane protein